MVLTKEYLGEILATFKGDIFPLLWAFSSIICGGNNAVAASFVE